MICRGCSDDPLKSPVPDTKPSCTAIIDACHPLDKGPGAIHECHEEAEADTATEASCTAKKAACLSTCKPGASKADGGA